MSKSIVLKSRHDAQQQEKEVWLQKRLEALDYYNGNTDEYVMGEYIGSKSDKMTPCSSNITKRVIDRISLCYMEPPKRTVASSKYEEYLHPNKNHRLQRFERLVNLLELVIIKPCWRNDRVEYDIIYDFEPEFEGDDPLKPTAFSFPLATRSSVYDDSEETWQYWSDSEAFQFKINSNQKMFDEYNPEGLNFYEKMPLIPVFRDGRPDTFYLDTTASQDLIRGHLKIIDLMTTKHQNQKFQSFGYLVAKGEMQNDHLAIAPDIITRIEIDSSLEILTPPDTSQSIDSSIRSMYKMLAQNYHLSTSFVDESEQASSGISLAIRNVELRDKRKQDISRWRAFEHELHEMERMLIKFHKNYDIGELENVDFGEMEEVYTPTEKRALEKDDLEMGIKDLADILQERNPDMTREDAIAYLEERKPKTAGSTLLDALRSE
jgi:hypothetical protein